MNEADARDLARKILQKAGNCPGLMYPIIELQRSGTLSAEQLKAFCEAEPKDLYKAIEEKGITSNLKGFVEVEAAKFLLQMN